MRRISQSGRPAVLALLKREGPVSADALAETLGVTAMAVRQHLYALAQEGLATHTEEARARGRPVKLWAATAKADAQFAESHAALAVDLIGQMRKAFGEEGLDKLLRLRPAEQEKVYRTETGSKKTLKARLEALAKILARAKATWPRSGVIRRRADGCWSRTIARSAPRRDSARAFAVRSSPVPAVLGRHIRVERISHIIAGATRCAYRVSEGVEPFKRDQNMFVIPGEREARGKGTQQASVSEREGVTQRANARAGSP